MNLIIAKCQNLPSPNKFKKSQTHVFWMINRSWHQVRVFELKSGEKVRAYQKKRTNFWKILKIKSLKSTKSNFTVPWIWESTKFQYWNFVDSQIHGTVKLLFVDLSDFILSIFQKLVLFFWYALTFSPLFSSKTLTWCQDRFIIQKTWVCDFLNLFGEGKFWHFAIIRFTLVVD